MHKYNELYKGNSEKYKGKIRKQDISIFGPYTQFCRISKMVGCTPEVLTLLLTPILTYIHTVYVRAPYMSFMSYMTLSYDICRSYCMSILVSKEALGPQECNPTS